MVEPLLKDTEPLYPAFGPVSVVTKDQSASVTVPYLITSVSPVDVIEDPSKVKLYPAEGPLILFV